MPLGIGNMESLQMLSNFIVTKKNGSRIRELGKLRHIRETLFISGLHNVTDPMDAKGACIKEKEQLSKLIMLYGATSDEVPNEGVKREVLHMLQPHKNLIELHIRGYHGTRFPNWLENPLFTNMVHVTIENCKSCSVLPPFGQLLSLKQLYVKGMNGVKHVGREFYGKLSSKPFPDLETLSFEDMPNWEDWFAFGVEDKVQPFVYVNKLLIKNCPNLLGKFPTNLPCLKVLEIRKCEKLVVELDGFVYPSLTSRNVDGVELPFTPPMINNVNNTHESSSLASSVIKNVSMTDSLFNMNISFQHLNSVEIMNVPKLVNLPKWLTHDLTALKQLDIVSCEELETLLDYSNREVMQLQHQIPVLKHLRIRYCPELVSLFVAEEKMDGECSMQIKSEAVQIFMRSLESLSLRYCNKLEKLPCEMYMLTSLVELEIVGCDNLVSLPDTGLPPMLRSLRINDCKALETSLPYWNCDNNLEYIEVSCCPSLTCLISSSCSSNNNSIRSGGLPQSLKRLAVDRCGKLEVIVEGHEENKIHCPSLEDIYINDCGRLKYLPDTRSDDSLGKLKQLNLSMCGDLQYLPDGWFRAITNLSHICIWGEGETRVFPYILKEAGFLANLDSLWLQDITTVVHPSEWGLQRLSSLRELYIWGLIRVAREGEGEGELVEVSVFPLDGMLLPTSLTILDIYSFPELERLSSQGFECLSSLKRLYLNDCPRLAYFPEGGLPVLRMKHNTDPSGIFY